MRHARSDSMRFVVSEAGSFPSTQLTAAAFLPVQGDVSQAVGDQANETIHLKAALDCSRVPITPQDGAEHHDAFDTVR